MRLLNPNQALDALADAMVAYLWNEHEVRPVKPREWLGYAVLMGSMAFAWSEGDYWMAIVPTLLMPLVWLNAMSLARTPKDVRNVRNMRWRRFAACHIVRWSFVLYVLIDVASGAAALALLNAGWLIYMLLGDGIEPTEPPARRRRLADLVPQLGGVR